MVAAAMPYLWRAVAVRGGAVGEGGAVGALMNFSLVSPPPAAPPSGLTIGTAVYLVAFRHWWRHQSDGNGTCRECRLRWPCDSLRLHDGILGELCRRGSQQALAAGKARRRPPATK